MKKILLILVTLNILVSFCKAQTCNNWLYTPSVSSSVSVGDTLMFPVIKLLLKQLSTEPPLICQMVEITLKEI